MCPLCEKLRSDASLIVRLEQTTVYLCDNQGCRGWCVAVLNEHHEHMADLPIPRQQQVFAEVARTANAIRAAVGNVRINYECLGNQVPHIHWHIIPRHADDPTPKLAVWGWSPDQLKGSLTEQQRTELAESIRAHF